MFQSNIWLRAGAVLAALSCGGQARADEKADALIKQVTAAYANVKTLSGTLTKIETHTRSDRNFLRGVTTEQIELKLPAFAYIVTEKKVKGHGRVFGADYTEHYTRVADDKTIWVFDGGINHYNHFINWGVENAVLIGYSSLMIGESSILMSEFYTPVSFSPLIERTNSPNPDLKRIVERHCAGKTKYHGVLCDVVEQNSKVYDKQQRHPYTSKTRFYIGPDKLLRGYSSKEDIPPTTYRHLHLTETSEEYIVDLKVNQDIPDSRFIFTPPAGATLDASLEDNLGDL